MVAPALAAPPDRKTGIVGRLREFLPSPGEFWAAIRETERGDASVLQIRCWRIFCGAAILTAFALVLFQIIIHHGIVPAAMANGYNGNSAPIDLKILDLRNGYSVGEVTQVLAWWGTNGRLAYILIEVIDVFVYHVGYRLAFVVLFNNMVSTALQQYPSYTILSWCPRIPLYLAKIDMIEDLLQITLVCMYEFHASKGAERVATFVQQDYFAKLVRISSAVNLLKWGFMKCGFVIFLYLWTVIRLGGAIKKLEKKD